MYFVFLWQAVDHATADADLEEFRRIRCEQDMEFEESLRIDRRKVHTFHSLFSICVIIIMCVFQAEDAARARQREECSYLCPAHILINMFIPPPDGYTIKGQTAAKIS